ncbi:MAG TPA: rhodanese-like domain-containing protein [Polyangiaceae bacterium]
MASEIKPVSPQQAAELQKDGALYLDVRTEQEFAEGHAPGALNVPLLHQAAGGMQENSEFLQVMQSAFAKDARLVVGCRSGVRSRRAAGLLIQAGFSDVADMTGGFEGGRDAFGRALAGWRQQNLPVEVGSPDGQSYADVKQRQSG